MKVTFFPFLFLVIFRVWMDVLDTQGVVDHEELR